MPFAAANSCTSGDASLPSTPRKTTLRGVYAADELTRSGVSARHGGHQVAKKLTTTTLPRKSESLTDFPPVVCSEKSGAIEPSAGEAASAARGQSRPVMT